jgi:hypothetical protein
LEEQLAVMPDALDCFCGLKGTLGSCHRRGYRGRVGWVVLVHASHLHHRKAENRGLHRPQDGCRDADLREEKTAPTHGPAAPAVPGDSSVVENTPAEIELGALRLHRLPSITQAGNAPT